VKLTGETDAEVLATLRGDSDCPPDVLKLATRAAAKRLLAACHQRALTATDADTASSSNSSRTIHPARVPDSDSTLPNYSRTYYARLRRELQQAMGLAVSPLFDED
jgi:hypothetical protein